MLERYPKLKAESPNPFIDAASCTLEADVQEAMYHALPEEQKAALRECGRGTLIFIN
jgi:hypothetical protein